MSDRDQKELIAELKRLNNNIELQLRYVRNWRVPLRNGMMLGLGSAIGATVLVSMAIKMFQPLKEITVLRQAIERLEHR